MKINILDKKNNVLLDRIDIKFEIVEENETPKRLEVKDKLAALINHDPNLVVIQTIKQQTGIRKSVGIAHAYKTKEIMMRVEQEHLIKRSNPPPKEEKKEEEAEPESGKKEEKKKK